jgi:thiaminase (transcriptional activator TenA)
VSTTEVLWSDIEPVYAAILEHPFVTGLTDGSLPRAKFAHYIVQDAHYLRGYARALTLCAARAPDEQALAMFAAHAGQALTAEQELHAELRKDLGEPDGPIAPATQQYVSYLLATAYSGSYAEAVAAVLPCYWIYARVGEHLVGAGSPDPLYARWIGTYGGDAFRETVDAVLAATDRIPVTDDMRRHFTTTSRYEWMFWDGAWREETWPV